ncbi:MAG: hypothetical protein KME26_13895 [Oscillatoria princeps RMCB-10]|nr:hypothetical protein [Oscillatoria princeps RMCB-10]
MLRLVGSNLSYISAEQKKPGFLPLRPRVGIWAQTVAPGRNPPALLIWAWVEPTGTVVKKPGFSKKPGFCSVAPASVLSA